MRKFSSISRTCLMLFIILTGSSLSAQPIDIDWTLSKQFQLAGAPLDIAISEDGELLFVLTPGEIAVYSDSSDLPFKQIPVEDDFNHLIYSESSRSLVLTNPTTNTLKILEIDLIQKIDIEGSPFKGPANAPVTLAVFDDYQCPYCAQLESLFRQILEKYPDDVKLVVKHFPLRSHNMAFKAATAALAAERQGKFWEFHSKLFENYRSLSDEKLEEIAAQLGLDMQKFSTDQKTTAIRSIILRDMKNAQSVGIKGTPALFINGKQVKNRSFQNLSRLIETELKKSRPQ